MNQFDYSVIPVGDFLNELGMKNVNKDGNEWKFSCPFPGHRHGDANPSASMQEETTLWHCFGCGLGGNCVAFLAELEGISRQKARRFIIERFGDGFKEPIASFLDEIEAKLAYNERDIKGLRRNIVLDENECNRRYVDLWSDRGKDARNYMLGRGFSNDTLIHFKVGYDHISDRPCFPIRAGDGKLIGFKARSYKNLQTPRYLILGGPEYGFEHYEASRAIFGLDSVSGDSIVLTEGELNAMMLRQLGYQSVGISGKILSAWQANDILNRFNEIVLIFDEQVDAIRASEKLQAIRVRIVESHEKDPAEWNDFDAYRYISQAKSPLQMVVNSL